MSNSEHSSTKDKSFGDASTDIPRAPDLEEELDFLQSRLPDRAARLVSCMRRPTAVWIRIPTAGLLVLGGLLGFLPILGFWMLPLGLALLAPDMPFMRRPLARLLTLVNRKLARRAEQELGQSRNGRDSR